MKRVKNMKLLLTGFVPFLDNPINPTEEIVKRLDGKEINGYTIETAVLPVDFAESEQRVLAEIREKQPDVVIMLGLAAGRSKITPERIAINVKDGAADNNGYTPVDEPIDANGPDGLFSTLPIRNMVTKLKENNYPATISNTAGAYLCNNIMYAAINEARKSEEPFSAGFIHIPASHELAIQNDRLPSWSLDDLTESIKICIEAL